MDVAVVGCQNNESSLRALNIGEPNYTDQKHYEVKSGVFFLKDHSLFDEYQTHDESDREAESIP